MSRAFIFLAEMLLVAVALAAVCATIVTVYFLMGGQ